MVSFYNFLERSVLGAKGRKTEPQTAKNKNPAPRCGAWRRSALGCPRTPRPLHALGSCPSVLSEFYIGGGSGDLVGM